MGPNGSGQEHAGPGARRASGVRGDRRVRDLRGPGPARAWSPRSGAQAGVFLAFQYPVEIPGVTNAYFLRAAYNEIRKAGRGGARPDRLRSTCWTRSSSSSRWDPRCSSRSVNTGFSGGEKKRNEILQMAVLEPRLAILDETDSGLDIDALRIVAEGVNALRRPDNATIVVTHYQRLLNYIVPDYVHVLSAADREVRRQGAGARARGAGLRLGRGGERRRRVASERGLPPPLDVRAFHGAATAEARPMGAVAARAAITRSPSSAFPTTKNEDWHFTSVAPIAERSSTRRAGGAGRGRAARAILFRRADWHALVFVNGGFAPALSASRGCPDGVTRRAWQALATRRLLVERAPRHATPFDETPSPRSTPRSSRTARSCTSADGVEVERPIHLLFVPPCRARQRRGRTRAT